MITVEVKTKDEGDGFLNWVVTKALAEEGITITPVGKHDTLKKRIVDVIPPQGIEDTAVTLAKKNIAQKIGASGMLLIGTVNMSDLRDPTAADFSAGTSLTCTYSFKVEIQSIKAVEICLVSPMAKFDGVSIVNQNLDVSRAVRGAEKVCRTLESATADYELPLTNKNAVKSLSLIEICYVYTPADVERMSRLSEKSAAEATKLLKREYEALAVLYTCDFYEQGIRPGAPWMADGRLIVDSARNGISGDSPKFVREATIGKDGIVRILIDDVGFPSKVTVKVGGDPGKSEKLQNELESRYVKGSETSRLVTDPRRLNTLDAVESDIEFLQNDPDILAARKLSGGTEDEILFSVTPKQRLSREVKFAAGVAYSPEKNVTGLIQADLSGTTLQDDSIKFNFESGVETLGGSGEIEFPLYNDPESPRFFLRASSEELDKAYLGNLSRPSFESRRDVGEMGMKKFLDRSSHFQRYEAERAFRKDRDRWADFLSVEGGVRHTNVALDVASSAGLGEGSYAGPYLEIEHLHEYDGRDGTVATDWQRCLIDTRLELDSGLETLSDGDDFARARISSDVWAIIKSRGVTAGYFLMGVTGAWASDDTPAAMSFGAGGGSFIRGLHADEFVGRSYIGGRAEAGVNLKWLMNGTGKRDTADGSEEPSTDLSAQQIFVGAFADFGSLSHRVRDGADVSGSKRLQGYGVQLQVMNGTVWQHGAALSLGYGWSPDSGLHESGTIFSRVSFEF